MKDLIFSAKAGVFSLLNKKALFNQVFVQHGAVTWPGEIDLSSEVMYAEFKRHKRWKLS